MRTLSARILLGFAALTLAFGAITALLVGYSMQVENHVVLIRNGYVPLALKSKELANRQDDLHHYLDKQLVDESNARLAGQNVTRLRRARDLYLDKNRQVIASVEQLPETDPQQFKESRPLLESIARAVESLEPLYAELIAAPPIAANQPPPPEILEAFLLPVPSHEPRREAGIVALEQLRAEEKKIVQLTKQFDKNAEYYAGRTSNQLLENQVTVRTRTIWLGVAAVGLGLVIMIWVVITLRPLRRLRDGARRIAAGDYASRIPERGPSEVSELATEFNSMGRAVEERERELVRSERLAAVGKMAAMITHEVRNPLSSIGLNTELLEEELGSGASAEARDLCRSIHREVDRLTAITEEYLAFARLPKPKLAAEPINPLVGALAAFVREDLSAKRVKLVTDLAGGDPIAQIDAGQIRQCLVNLVRNATEALATTDGGTVTLRTRTVGPRIEIAVLDDGPGIAPDVLPRLFDPFFSTKEAGNGLGLALTQQIVRDHGGDLRVESTVGRGTTFTLSVPTSG